MKLPPAVFLMGPTAAGKTAVALELAARLPVALISVDSAQVYRGLDIGSAKPDRQTLEQFPHALLDIRDPEQTYSAAEFVSDAEDEIRRAAGQGRLPVLVGGTMLYHRALLFGLDPLPPANPELRARLEREAAEAGWPAMHSRLCQLDPQAGRRIRANDPQRIGRALEVIELTGRPLSEQQSGKPPGAGRTWPTLRLVVTPPERHILHKRIAQRLDAMLAQGFLNEVKELMKRPGLSADSPAMRAVGYRQAWQHLNGQTTQAEFEASAQAATRQLAKRQLTWLRQMPDALWYDPSSGGTINRIISRVEVFKSTQ